MSKPNIVGMVDKAWGKRGQKGQGRDLYDTSGGPKKGSRAPSGPRTSKTTPGTATTARYGKAKGKGGTTRPARRAPAPPSRPPRRP